MRSNNTGSVTARLKGGLGNQLFQYAAGKALAQQLGNPFFIDIGFYLKPHSNRQFKLPDIGVTANTNNFSKAKRISSKAASSLLPKNLNGDINYVTEPADYGFHGIACDASEQVYLDGYWQSEKYFIELRQQLLDEIDLSHIELSQSAVEFPSDNTVAVHVRRGDFISQSSSQALSSDYVERAMREFGSNVDFMFFSDDIRWCQDNFKGDNIAFANNKTDLQDLKQMSEAAHNIIANSTFSWWGAWLNKNAGQRVVAPQPWTNEDTHRDILSESWERIVLRS